MKYRPDANFNRITDIKPDFFEEKGIKGIILDVDNTLITLDGEKLDGIDEWVKQIKKSGIKIYIASNTLRLNSRKKILKITTK